MNATTKVVQRVSAEGHPFTEMLHQWTDQNGKVRHALSRCNYAVAAGKHGEAAQNEAFKERMKKW